MAKTPALALKPAHVPAKKNHRNVISVPFSDETYALLQADAQKNFRSEAAQVRMIVEQWAAKQPAGR